MSERMSDRERAIRVKRVQSRLARERATFERETSAQDQRDQALARQDTGRSGRARGGYGLPW